MMKQEKRLDPDTAKAIYERSFNECQDRRLRIVSVTKE